MANLIIPNKSKHKYVVGIDFGHGETSAAICELEWDKSAAHRLANVTDIDVDYNARKKVIPSAICRTNYGSFIGDEAFEHTTDNEGIRIGFKKCPQSLDGEDETLMCDYMSAVYSRIVESDDRLLPGNHVVYIARPSGWTDETVKELYRQMALKAGIPLAGLMSESRAAIFYAKTPKVDFANEINCGGIVFDLGSSTLDFTHLSDDDNPVDFGYDLGASKIEEVIYKRMILKLPEVQDFVKKNPVYKDALLFQARKFKEVAYSRNCEIRTVAGFPLSSILTENLSLCSEYGNIYVPLCITNLQELNDLVEEEGAYQKKLRGALVDFKENHIKGKKVNGVFLTGGTSRMNFIRPLIAEVMGLPIEKVKPDKDNPSLTISRGIALLGATDAITAHLVAELKSNQSSFVNSDVMFGKLVKSLSDSLADAAWKQVEATCKRWIQSGSGRDEDELRYWLKSDLESFQSRKLKEVVEGTVRKFVVSEGEVIRKKTNEIISNYAPGREITVSGSVSVGDMSAVNKSIENLSATISEICDSITNTLTNALWAALGVFLFGLFSVAYYVCKGIYNFFRDDKDVRKEKAQILLDKRLEVYGKVRNQLNEQLSQNRQFKKSLTSSLSHYFNNILESNLQKVIIPIE